MLQIGEVVISADVEDIVSQIQEDTELLRDINELETDIMCTCPIHKGGMEQTPSLGINKESGVVHCFTCGYKGDIVTLVSDCYDISYSQAYRKLVGHFVYSGRRVLDIDITPTRTAPTTIPSSHVRHYTLHNLPVLQYLSGRGISPTVANDFPIGYNPDRGTAMFYVQDLKGNFIYYKERAINRKAFYNTTGVKKSDYLYGAYQLLQSSWQPEDPVWICESEIDALTVWSRGGYAVAIGGSHISKAQLNILKTLGVRRLVDGLDRDEAGREGWQNLCTYIKGISTYNTKYPVNKKDINDLTEEEFNNIKIY